MRLNKHVCAARNQRKHDHAGWLQAVTALVLGVHPSTDGDARDPHRRARARSLLGG